MDNTAQHYDFAIIGAGVTGALIAERLSREDCTVILLEAGRAISPDARMEMVGSYAREVNRTPHAPYVDAAADREAPVPLVTDGSDNGRYKQTTPQTPFKSTYQRLTGGSTWHWLGNTPRFLRNDFRLRSKYGLADDWPIDYDDLEPWYCSAERELGVAGDDAAWDGFGGANRSEPFPMPPIWPAYGDHVVKDAIEGLEAGGAHVAVRTTPQARNSIPYQGRPPCAGNSSCVPICPIGAKYDATVHVDKAVSQGVTLIAQTIVQELTLREDGSVSEIIFDQWDDTGGRQRGSVSATRVVVAAHAIETPLLLLGSKIAPASPVGGYLMDHLQGYGLALLPTPVFPFRGPPVTSGIDAYRDGPWRGERAAYRLSIGNDGWGRSEHPTDTAAALIDQGLWGEPLRNALRDRLTRMIRISYSTEMCPDPSNRVTLAGTDERGNLRPAIDFSLPDYNIAAFEHAKLVMAKVFSRLEAAETQYTYPAKNYSGAGHIMGTCRMGKDPLTSVTDADCRVHGHSNLFVAGASLFTTGGTANPTLTAAALALRLGELLAREIGEVR